MWFFYNKHKESDLMYKSNINLNLYKTFYDVAKCGSISKAAQENYTSQPAISKSIKKLESELDTQLFYRTLKGVELTEKGKDLLYFVEKSFNNLVIAERNMIETENLERGKLSVGMPSNIGTFFLFDKIIDFHKIFPKIEITIVSGSTSNLLNLLDSHKIDFAIDTSPIKITEDSNIQIKKLKEVEYCFIVKKNSEILKNKEINSLKDLKNCPLILPIPGTANRNDLDELLKKENIAIENVINIHTSEMIIAGVKKDLGIGYVIYDLVLNEILNGELEVIKVKEKLPTVEINIIYNEHFLTTAPKKFIKDYISYDLKL
jgi:DNA-binding transcriptional LysR family regulator